MTVELLLSRIGLACSVLAIILSALSLWWTP